MLLLLQLIVMLGNSLHLMTQPVIRVQRVHTSQKPIKSSVLIVRMATVQPQREQRHRMSA